MMMRTYAGAGGSPGTPTSLMVAGAEEGRVCNSHSEAERKRRQRINDQLGRLRQLLPHTARMDKASLLTEVVRELRELRRRAADLVGPNYHDDAWGPAFPGEADEVILDWGEGSGISPDIVRDDGEGGGGGTMATASVCCQDRSGLFTDVSEALRSARIRVARAEMATIGGRTKAVLLVEALGTTSDVGGYGRRSALQAALRSAIEGPRGRVAAGVGGSAAAKRMRLAQRGGAAGAAAYYYEGGFIS
ncbi:hypothetical protein Taro_013546 [Colocasia esculenta]|uniref:BHLH domain-containing protein n=1 Tax=Colocasia esculenta TaxID=4460 RepID=A0A843UGH6_COLES|nr:hypothetical protein [Colocasia esculenta]